MSGYRLFEYAESSHEYTVEPSTSILIEPQSSHRACRMVLVQTRESLAGASPRRSGLRGRVSHSVLSGWNIRPRFTFERNHDTLAYPLTDHVSGATAHLTIIHFLGGM